MDKSPRTQNHILLSACRGGGVSYEFYHPKLRPYRGIDSNKLHSNIYGALLRNGFDQHSTVFGNYWLRLREFIGSKF